MTSSQINNQRRSAIVKVIRLPAMGEGPAGINSIVETPKGSRNKFDYDPKSGLFELGAPMPAGLEFPFEFGFIPSTLADDGDPLDVLILMEAPTFVGCLVRARVVGVIEAIQKEKDGKEERNDRLIAVALESRHHKDVISIKELPESLLSEIEHFFASYNEMKGKAFTTLGRFSSRRAMKLVKRAVRRARQ